MRRASAYPSRPVPLWRNHDYLLLRGGQGVSNFGSAVQGVVTPLLILAISHSPAQAGIAAALGSLPFFLLSLPAGALVDRWDRKWVMIVCDIGRTVATASIPIALWSGHLTVPLLYVVSGISGTFFVFFNLAETSCLPRVVTKEQLPAATSHNEAVDYASFILGRPAGGFLYQTIGQAAPFLANAVSFAVSAVSLLFIRTRFQEDRVPTPRDLRAEITEGLRWLWNQPLIRFMAFLNGGQNLLYSGIALVIIVLAQKEGASPTTIGIVFAVASIGGLAGAVLAPAVQRRWSFGQAVIGLLAIQAVLLPLLLVVKQPLLLGVVYAAQLTVSPMYNVVQFSYRLALIPDILQGRVNSAFRLIAFSFNPLGAALSGLLLETVGPGRTVAFLSVWMAALALASLSNSRVRDAPAVTST